MKRKNVMNWPIELGVANRLSDDLDEVWWRGEQWAVTSYGLEELTGRYPIERERLGETTPDEKLDWPLHMADKAWVNVPEFLTAYSVACIMHHAIVSPTALREACSEAMKKVAQRDAEQYILAHLVEAAGRKQQHLVGAARATFKRVAAWARDYRHDTGAYPSRDLILTEYECRQIITAFGRYGKAAPTPGGFDRNTLRFAFSPWGDWISELPDPDRSLF